MTDETENDRLRENLAATEADLERLRARFDEELERQKIDALAEFAAGAGHEINNPLAIISGHAQLLLREIEHPEHRRQIAVIAAQAKRAYEMIADIRYFARPPQPEPQQVDLMENLALLAREQEPLMTEAGIDFRFESTWPEGQTVFVRTDPVQIHIAATFLCNNAREILMPQGGRVRLRLQQAANSDSMLEILVEDDGPGVAEEIRPLIFCPYFSGRQAGRGLGFGLSKAWRIMLQLGGGIRYVPVETGGSRFVLSLPAGPDV